VLVVAGLALARLRIRRSEVLLIAVVVAQAAYAAVAGGDAWEHFLIPDRYISVVLPALAVLAGLATARLVEAGRAALAPLAAAIAAAGLLMIVERSLSEATLERFLLSVGSAPPVLNEHAGLAATIIGGAVAIAGLIAVAFVRSSAAASTATASVMIACIVASNAVAIGSWITGGAPDVARDVSLARQGETVRELTDPRAVVAVTDAGAIPYFDQRTSIDMLGKSDSFIAHTTPHDAISVRPGHTKWDYAYSVDKLRPDLVTYVPTSANADMERWGYVHLGWWTWVRRDSALVSSTEVAQYVRTDPIVG
jgi:exosortase/archaeosortase